MTRSAKTVRSVHLPGPLFVYIRLVISAVFIASGLYKLAYLELDALFAAHYAEDSKIPLDVLATKPVLEFWPGIPCASRLDDAMRHYLFLSPEMMARVRPWYPVGFLVGAVWELVGAAMFVGGRRGGARLLLMVLGVTTLVMHPVWDEASRFDAVGVAVANAGEKARRAADVVSNWTNDEGAVGRAIDEWVL